MSPKETKPKALIRYIKNGVVGVGQSTYREWGHTDNTPKTCDRVAAQIFPANGIVVLIRFCACYRCDGMSLRLSDYHSLAISFNEPQQRFSSRFLLLQIFTFWSSVTR